MNGSAESSRSCDMAGHLGATAAGQKSQGSGAPSTALAGRNRSCAEYGPGGKGHASEYAGCARPARGAVSEPGPRTSRSREPGRTVADRPAGPPGRHQLGVAGVRQHHASRPEDQIAVGIGHAVARTRRDPLDRSSSESGSRKTTTVPRRASDPRRVDEQPIARLDRRAHRGLRHDDRHGLVGVGPAERRCARERSGKGRISWGRPATRVFSLPPVAFQAARSRRSGRAASWRRRCPSRP